MGAVLSARRICAARCRFAGWSHHSQQQLIGRLPTAPNPFVGVPDPDYTGWYVEGSWFFGGHKNYNEEGRWGRPTVDNPMFHGSGGWGPCSSWANMTSSSMSDTGNDVLFGSTRPVHPSFVGACATTYAFSRATGEHDAHQRQRGQGRRVRRHEDLGRRRQLVDDRLYALISSTLNLTLVGYRHHSARGLRSSAMHRRRVRRRHDQRLRHARPS